MPANAEIDLNGPCLTNAAIAFVVAVSGCVSAPIAVQERESYWRRLLAEQVSGGMPRNEVVSVYKHYGLNAGEGAYRTAHPDGAETSACRFPDKALSVFDRGAVRGLYINRDIGVTVCFAEQDAVESYYAGAWNAGI